MKVIQFYKSDNTKSWKLDISYTRWGHDICLRTEGTLLLQDATNKIVLDIFLLEFFIELKSLILRTLGNPTFERKLALPISGDGVLISRDNSTLTFKKHHSDLCVLYDWDCFLENTIILQLELASSLAKSFPEIAKTKEFKILFEKG